MGHFTFKASSTCQHHQQREFDNSEDEDEHDNNQDNAESEEPPPPRQPPPRNQPQLHPPSQTAEQMYNPKLWLNNPELCEMIGRSLGASLHILDLGLGASKIEAKMKY